jgi:hypothetical protein
MEKVEGGREEEEAGGRYIEEAFGFGILLLCLLPPSLPREVNAVKAISIIIGRFST